MTTYPDDIYSVRDAARILGLSAYRVRVLLVSRGLGQHIGRTWVLRSADIDAMRSRKVGRPFGQGALPVRNVPPSGGQHRQHHRD